MLSFKDVKFLEKNKKARDTQGLFIAEGMKLFEEAPPELIEQVLMTRRFAEEHPEAFEKIPNGASVQADIDETRFFSISDTKTPQGILTVLRQPAWPDSAFFGMAAPLYVVLENLQDPGNAGTILRTAEAAGATAVFLTEGSVDLYSPKTTRATMGSIFRVPHLVVRDEAALIREMQRRGTKVYAAHLKGRRYYTDLDLRGGSAFVIGNEGRGVTDETAAECSELVKIPMMGRVESLNAAMAAGILMYEAQRQRRI